MPFFLPLKFLPVGDMNEKFKRLSQPLLEALKQNGIAAELGQSAQGLEGAQPVQEDALCFKDMAGYELRVGKNKILGQAQRCGRYVFLAQGTFQGVQFKDVDNFVNGWLEKKVEALRVWGADSRASKNLIPALTLA